MKEFRLHGPPGCGKSHALATSWVPKAAERFGANRVVICSLTKTAASEIASRDLPIERENVGTLHALAYRSLGRPKVAESMVEEWNAQHPVYRLTGSGPSAENPELRHERESTADALMAMAQVYRHKMVPAAQWRDDVRAFHRKWMDWCDENDYLDFTGMIEAALASVPNAPGRPEVFVVDEAQDCSVLELSLVRKWAAEAEYVVLAGDGDQAIYGWRGASAKAFLGKHIPKENNYHLTQSYRVPRAVHLAASEWIRRASYRYAVEYKPRDFDGQVTTCRGSGKNIEPVIEAVQEDLAQGKTVMILGTCGFMLRGALAVLRREGIPFHNPLRPSQGSWNPMRGGVSRLRAFLRPDPDTYGVDARMWTWSEAAAWVDVLASRGVLAPSGKTMIRQMAADDTLADQMITPPDGRACFGPSWDALETAFSERRPIEWIERRLLTSKSRFMEYSIAIARKRGRQAIIEDPKLIIGTIHSVKGAEADNVYLLPDLSRSGMRDWMAPGDSRDGIIRTFYVGMTRAKEKLVMCRRWSPQSIDWTPTL